MRKIEGEHLEAIALNTQQKHLSLIYHDERKTMLRKSYNYASDMDLEAYSAATGSLHYHDHYEIFIYLGNQCQYIVNEVEYTLYNGDIIIIPPAVPHLMLSEEGINNSRYILMVPQNLLDQFALVNEPLREDILNFYDEPGHYRLDQESLDKTISYLIKILEFSDYAVEDSEFVTAYHLYQSLMKIFHAKKIPSMAGNYKDDKHFSHIIYYIDQHFRESDLQLERITQEFDISPYYLSKLFRKEMNQNFHEYLIEKRANYAAQLINNINTNKMSLQDVSNASGFGDYSTFYRSFKKVYNTSPKKYAQQHTQTIL
jgi:YesN/AraC family two-component response regulator